ncbi:MAG: phage portal protein [Clostridiales bacterium]|nr:phage portal protein [Clostridiales bacterium]
MELDIMKRLIKKYEPGHTGYIRECETAERYYRNRTDILLKKPKEDEEGKPLRNADNRIPRNFHGLIVNQKASYAFTAPPLFDVGNNTMNEKIADTLGDEYKKNCMELCVNAANCKTAWIHYWRGENGFEWAVVDSKEIIPVMSKSLKKKLMGVFRVYSDIDEVSGDTYMIYEYWTETECQAFRRRIGDTVDEGLLYYDMFMDPETGEMESQYRHDMGEVPFIPFRNNNITEDDLVNIKPLIDVYDKVYSGFINDLDDIQELIFILTGYGGTDLNGFLQDLKKYKTIKLDADEGADARTLSVEIPVEAREKVLDATRKAIFEQGQGFDPQPENFGNQSGEALKFMYALLEMKTGLMQTEFELGFAKLIRAICRFYGISCGKILQTWTRTCIKNDTEQATICQMSDGIVSRKTILKNHPFVEDADEEVRQLEKEEKEAQEKAELYGGAFKAKSQSQKGDGVKNGEEE